MTPPDLAAVDEAFEAVVEQLRSVFRGACQSRDEAERRLDEESGQRKQERAEFEKERLALRQEITRLQQLVRDQARDLNILAQAENDRAALEQQCAALQEELEALRSADGAPPENVPEPELAAAPAANGKQATAARDSRRIAMPCLVVVHRTESNDEVEGWAIERSLEGVAVLLDEKYSAGTPLRVRSAKSARGTWLDVVVESCRAERASFRVECTFANPVTWADIHTLAG